MTLTSEEDSSPKEDDVIAVEAERGLETNNFEAAVSSSDKTVTYSNSVTVVTSTISYETVAMKQDGKESVTTVTQSSREENHKEDGNELNKINNLNHVIHIDTTKVKGGVHSSESQTSEGHSSESRSSEGHSSEGHSSEGPSSNDDGGRHLCDVQVTNIDSVLTVADVTFNDVTGGNTYDVSDIMVTRI